MAFSQESDADAAWGSGPNPERAHLSLHAAPRALRDVRQTPGALDAANSSRRPELFVNFAGLKLPSPTWRRIRIVVATMGASSACTTPAETMKARSGGIAGAATSYSMGCAAADRLDAR